MTETVCPADIRLFHEPKDRLRLTIGDRRSYYTVKPVWSAPLSHPGRWLSLLDAKGDEIVLVEHLTELPCESLAAVQAELRLRYLCCTVSTVHSCRQEFGTTYWSVDTDRGRRDFVTQNLQENAQWLTESHLLLIDVDGNRFEVRDVSALDARSRALIHAIL